MRRDMRKLVRLTEIESAKIQMVDGEPIAEQMETEIVLGKLSMEEAQRHMEEVYDDHKITVLTITHKEQRYKGLVKDFMKVAEIEEEKII